MSYILNVGFFPHSINTPGYCTHPLEAQNRTTVLSTSKRVSNSYMGLALGGMADVSLPSAFWLMGIGIVMATILMGGTYRTAWARHQDEFTHPTKSSVTP